MRRACSIPTLLACSLLWGCKPADPAPSSADTLALQIRLDASDAKIAALESKLDAAVTKLDDTATRLEASTQTIEGLTRPAAGLGAPPQGLAEADTLDSVDRTTLFDSFQTEEGVTGPIRCEKHDDARATCRIDRVLMAELVAKPADLVRQARIVPALDGAAVRGFKVYGIRRDSLPKRLGLKNGDQITSVDGQRLDTLEDSMEIFAKAMRAESFVVGVERKGVPFALEIVVGERR